MATNFPNSADSFTNPTSGDTLDNPPHDQQHANINDAMEAVQASLLDGAPLHIDDANERVGVGTSSPEDVLHVVGDVTIEVNDDGSAAQPEVTLHRESASPADGDYLGQVKFAGKNDVGQTVNYAKVTGKIGDVTDGTEDGLIEIANVKAGSQSIGYRFTSTDLKLLNGRGLEVDGDVTVDTDTLHVDTTNNRVGIGTTSPSFPLSVDINAPATYGNAAGNFAQMWTNSGTNALGVSMGDDLDVGLITNNGYAFNLGTNGSTRMTIDSSGNVGINDTTPSYTLDVNGDINATGDLRIAGNPIGVVTNYTPTLNFASQGNGAVIARYARVNDLVHWEFQFTLGSTSVISNGFRPSLPFPARTVTSDHSRYGRTYIRRSASGEIYHGMYHYSESGANARPQIYNDNSSGLQRGQTTVSATSPFSWSAGDIIYMTGTYLAT